jgi:hypothetical protein
LTSRAPKVRQLRIAAFALFPIALQIGDCESGEACPAGQSRWLRELT